MSRVEEDARVADAASIPATVGDLAAFAVRAVSDQQLRLILSFSGSLDADRLSRAVRLLVQTWPVLGRRLVLGRRPQWAPGPEAAPEAVVASTGPAAALAAFVATASDPRTGPVFAVRLVRTTASGRGDALFLRVDHTVCDGAGARELAYELLGLYRGLAVDGAEDEPARPAGLWSPERRSYGPVLRAARVRDVARAAVLFPDHAAGFRLPYRSDSRALPRLVTVQIPAERVARARACGRAHGATLNDVLLTAVVRSLPPAGAGRSVAVPRPVQMPIDLRPRFPGGGDGLPPANLTGMTFPAVAVRTGEPFPVTLERVARATALAKTAVHALHIPAAFTLLFALRGTHHGLGFITRELRDGHADGRCTPVFTNVGAFDADRLHAGEDVSCTGAFFASPVMYPPGLTVAASEFAGAVTLSSGFCASAIEPAAVDSLLAHIVADLPK